MKAKNNCTPTARVSTEVYTAGTVRQQEASHARRFSKTMLRIRIYSRNLLGVSGLNSTAGQRWVQIVWERERMRFLLAAVVLLYCT